MTTPPPITSPYAPDMAQVRAWLEKMVRAVRFIELVAAVLALIGKMRDANTELLRQVAHLRRARPRSETLDRLRRQLVLPLDGLPAPVVVPAAANAEDATASGAGDKRRRAKHPGRGSLPAYLPRVQVFNPVSAAARICPVCGSEMTTVGHSRCEKLDVVPARIIVVERLDERVACPKDDTIVSAPTPPAIVEGGKLGDTLIVESLCDKYIEHQPIERQSTHWRRAGADIAPQTLGRGVAAAIDLLRPVTALIEDQTRAPGLLGTDATGIPVLDPSTPDGIRTGAMWCWTNARWVTFFYAPSADSDSVRRFLGRDLARTVQCDGTSVITFLERAGGKRPGCWSHGRRGLAEAARSGDSSALDGIRLIAKLFAVERVSTFAGDTADQRRARRLDHSRPVLDELRAWLDDKRAIIPPKTTFGRGLGYLHRQWHRLLLFLEDGNIELTNNRRERELRRLVLGRRNWLFTWLDLGGERTASVLTIIGTCIAHDVNPRAYLHLVTKLIVQGWPQAKLRELLPDRMLVEHPDLYIGDRDAVPALAAG
jgi:transposase